MPICRAPKNGNFTMIANELLQDSHISNKSKGLACMMLSYPNYWKFSVDFLARKCKDSKSSIKAQLNELEERGYVRREQPRKDNGRMDKVVYYIYENPADNPAHTAPPVDEADKPESDDAKVISLGKYQCQTGIPSPQADALPGNVTSVDVPHSKKPLAEKPLAGKPLAENPPVNNTRYNKQSNEQKTISDKESFPSYPLPKLTEPAATKHPEVTRNGKKRAREEQEELRRKALEQLKEQEEIREQIRENVGFYDFEILIPNETRRQIAFELVSILEDTVCSTKPYIRIGGENKPAEVVRSQLLKVDSSQIDMILENLERTTTDIRNVRQYLLTALYNAPATINTQIQAMVQHDDMDYRRKLAEVEQSGEGYCYGKGG